MPKGNPPADEPFAWSAALALAVAAALAGLLLWRVC